jgi:VanZ family protein
VSRRGVFIRFWLPVLLWAALIFWGSTDLLSEGQTSRIIGPVLRWLVPDLSDDAVGRVQFGLRKLGHIVEYAILGMLLYRAFRQPERPEGWSWRHAGLAFAATVAYAVSDELHQAMVPTRHGSAWDVLIDAVGAVLGLAALRIFERKRTRR